MSYVDTHQFSSCDYSSLHSINDRTKEKIYHSPEVSVHEPEQG